MHRYVPQVVLCATLACIVVNAVASASAGVNVTDFRVVLTALDPNAVPSVSFAGAGGSDAIAAAYAGRPDSNQVVISTGSTGFGPVSAMTGPDPEASSWAFLTGDVFSTGASAGATAHASSRAPLSVAQSQVGLVNDVGFAYFTLAPMTQITISANVDVWATATGAILNEHANAGMLMEIGDQDGDGSQNAFAIISAFANAFRRNEVESSDISVSYFNDTDTAITGTFGGYIDAYATSGGSVSDVPEPSSLSLMLGGAIATAGALRCRRLR